MRRPTEHEMTVAVAEHLQTHHGARARENRLDVANAIHCHRHGVANDMGTDLGHPLESPEELARKRAAKQAEGRERP